MPTAPATASPAAARHRLPRHRDARLDRPRDRRRPRRHGPVVVFITAFSSYATQAFDVSAVDYVLKPFSDQRFGEAVERAKRRVRERRLGELATQVANLSAELRHDEGEARGATGRAAPLPAAARHQGRRPIDRRQDRGHPLDRGRGLLRPDPLEAGAAHGARVDGVARAAARSASLPARAPHRDRQRRRGARPCTTAAACS